MILGTGISSATLKIKIFRQRDAESLEDQLNTWLATDDFDIYGIENSDTFAYVYYAVHVGT